MCHPNAESNKDLTPQHENEKKRMYASRVMEVEQAMFTPLVFTTTGGMAPECQIYHKRLEELLSAKKGEDYSTTMSWIRTRISFAILRNGKSIRQANQILRHCSNSQSALRTKSGHSEHKRERVCIRPNFSDSC